MSIQFVNLVPHCRHILSYLNPSVINGAIDVGAEHIHGHTSLTIHTLVPKIFVLCLEALELQQFCNLDLQSFSVAALAQSLL